ncbi:unnamed protein product [Vicia faba]|uniref:Ubiquitin-like protease family profile domain-containing protein n=1 Tax=Vicia faba TaxID=3906 RepID=A0AAV0ZCI3_VICFA|nr:unnamed protein product [Vicia faba]
MASIDDESGSSSKKTIGKRGVTRLQKIHKAKSNGKRIEVQWNSRGQPIKHNSKTFASFIGVTVRRLVPISLDNWSAKKNKEAVGVYKQNIWDEIEKAFIIGEEHRAFVYREAGKLHRAFRTKMARSYLKDSKGGFVKHRPAKYSFCIKQDDWDKFVAQHMTAKFQKVSDENRERALNPQHLYRKSRLGCARLEADMVEESEVGEINRSQVWKAARVNKSGVIDNENVQRVVDQCEKLTEALSEEERQDLGPTNILFEALNLPNYSGRVRTYGFGVCSRDILPRQNLPTQMDFEKLYGFCNSLKSRLEVLEREKIERDKLDREKLERQQTEEVEERQQPKQVSERLQQPEKVAQRQHLEQVVERKQPEKVAESRLPSDKGSCNPGSFDNIPEGLFHVNIYLSSPSRCLVARGKLYNTKGNTVHGMTLPPGYVKVNIDVAIVPNAPLPISVEDGDVSMVGQAIGTIVPWPTKLLEFVAECEKIPGQSQNKGNNIQHSVEYSVSSPNKSNKKFKIEESPRVGGSAGIANLPFLDMYVKKMMRVGSLIQIKMEESIFGEEFLEQLRVESIKEILDHNWLSASIITVFSRYLYDKFISPNGLINKFSFISPHVSREDNLGNGIAKILLKDEEFKDKMILAPCNLGKHWVLLVINLNAEVIYYMDPLNGEPTKHQNFKTKFENALQIYRANSSSKVPKVSKSKKISWQKIKCPRQINGVDCGYFVMRFMKEVIMENEFMIPTNYFFDHKCRTYSHDKLTEVKEDWATYVVDDVFGKQEAIILPN